MVAKKKAKKTSAAKKIAKKKVLKRAAPKAAVAAKSKARNSSKRSAAATIVGSKQNSKKKKSPAAKVLVSGSSQKKTTQAKATNRTFAANPVKPIAQASAKVIANTPAPAAVEARQVKDDRVRQERKELQARRERRERRYGSVMSVSETPRVPSAASAAADERKAAAVRLANANRLTQIEPRERRPSFPVGGEPSFAPERRVRPEPVGTKRKPPPPPPPPSDYTPPSYTTPGFAEGGVPNWGENQKPVEGEDIEEDELPIADTEANTDEEKGKAGEPPERRKPEPNRDLD